MNRSFEEFILQWNAGSLVSHWSEFKTYILNTNPLIAAVQETRFLDSDQTNYNFNVQGFSTYTDNINETPRHGGTALYISNKLLHHQLQLRTTLNAVGAKVKIANKDLSVVSVYLSPVNRNITQNQISELFSQIEKPCLIMGDFNAHHRAWGCTYTRQRGTQLLNVTEALDLIHVNDRTPTHRYTRNGNITYSVIDLAFADTDTATSFTPHVGDDPLFSDHYPIHYNLAVPSGQTNFKFLPRWNFKKADWASFQKHIDETITTPPEDINSFLNVILAAAHQYVPHTGPPKENRKSPWWNEKCNRAVAIRKRALRKFEKYPNDVNEELARRTHYEANNVILEEKTKSWKEFSGSFNRFTPLSKIWSLIKCFSHKRNKSYKIPHLRVNDNHYLLPSEVAAQFAKHYAEISSAQQYSTDVTESLNETLATLDFHSDNNERYNAPYTLSELQHAISHCGDTSVGPDQIAYSFFKNISPLALETLLNMYNLVWENNTYPQSWNLSTLIPIL